MTLTEQDRQRAIVAARVAARHDIPLTACPWKGADDRHRALRGIWVRTYLHHRPDLRGTVDYSG